VKRLRAATVDELAEVAGVGRLTAQLVHQALAPPHADPDGAAPTEAVTPEGTTT
jgi:hypothetical protein